MSCQTFNFTNYTVESGLSQPQILSMYQDKQGVMWFGTNGGGITKFDGKNYEKFTIKEGLPDNVVYTIKEDKVGRILVGTNNGLTVIDGKKIRNYTDKEGLSHNRIFIIYFDSQGNTLLGTGKGVSMLKDSACSIYNIDESLNNSSVFNIMEDTDHNIWFSTIGNGAFSLNHNSVKNYKTGFGLNTDYVYSVVEKEKNEFWFLTDIGILEYKNKQIKKLENQPVLNDVTYYSHLKDKNNNLWFSTSEGVIKYDYKKFKLFTQKNGLVNNNIWKSFQDREGNFWFASRENGISKLPNESFSMYNVEDGLLFNTIDRIYQSKDGRYWLGSRKGLTLYDGKKFVNFDQKDWKLNNEVTAIVEDNEGIIYIGTSYGVLKYDGKIFTRIEAEFKRGLNYIYDIYIDSRGEIWLGTKLGVALIKNGSIVEYNQKIPRNFVYKIYEDNSNNIWFGTEDGLYVLSNKNIRKITVKDGFSAKHIYNIVEDKKNSLWIGTSSGVYKYSNKKFIVLTEKEGLASNDVQSIAINKEGIIWVGLSNGIDRIQEIENGKFNIRHYGIEDGVLGEECMLNSILVDHQNKLWFGAQKGLMIYHPQYDRKNELDPITRIKNVLLFGQNTDWEIFADSINQDNLPVNLELDYNRNSLTFNFIGVSHTAPAKVRYKYMLKGYDKDWMPETERTEKSYSNLNPGKYEFMVIANNGDGVWNKQPATFSFTILPPFWQTWWFYCIIAGIVLTGVYSYVKIKSANIKIVKQSHIIEEKNEEIKKAYSEIEGKNKSITDSINYAKRIQESFLSSDNNLKRCLKEYFIFYKPRDIVSGDFYWCFDLPDKTLIACADSTGHGIPGAFMSLIGISLLNEISHSKKMTEPSKVLDELRRIIICALNPEQLDEGGKDGLDIALISIFKSNSDDVKIHFSGGNIALHVVSSVQDTKELVEYKGDKQPVGFYSNMTPFTQQEITAKKGDIIYMFTDGYADQFGGLQGKKFMSRQLKKTLLNISELPLQNQNKELEAAFNSWKGNLDQVDDVTVMGIKIG